jgi:Fur family ferric uptake transcriptional regulator
MEQFVSDTLKSHKLRTTACRENVLQTFQNRATALSHGDLEEALKDQHFDRVTIPDDEGLRYALCREHCVDDDHHHDHVHFKCNECGETNCLEDLLVPSIKLPEGYRVQEVNLLIQGLCEKCS